MKGYLLVMSCLTYQLMTTTATYAADCPADACIVRSAPGPAPGLDRDWDMDLVEGLKWIGKQLTSAWHFVEGLFSPGHVAGMFAPPFAEAYAGFESTVNAAISAYGWPTPDDLARAIEQERALQFRFAIEQQAFLAQQPAWRFEQREDGKLILYTPSNATRDLLNQYYGHLDEAARVTRDLQEQLQAQKNQFASASRTQAEALSQTLPAVDEARRGLSDLHAAHTGTSAQLEAITRAAEPAPVQPRHVTDVPHASPADDNVYGFLTPSKSTGFARLVEARRHHEAALAFAEQASDHRTEREGLLAVANAGIKAADMSYASGDVTSGDELIDGVADLLDTVFEAATDAVTWAMHTRAANFLAGVIRGVFGLPLEPKLGLGLEEAFYLGETIGVAVGLSADAGAIAAGLATMASGAAISVGSGGTLAVAAAPAITAGIGMIAAGGAFWAVHEERFREAREQYLFSKAQGKTSIGDSYLGPLGSKAVERGSTADPAKGSRLPQNLREQLAVEEALSDPLAGQKLFRITMSDPRFPADQGWIKMQKVVNTGANGGDTINVHYLYNEITGEIADAKIIVR